MKKQSPKEAVIFFFFFLFFKRIREKLEASMGSQRYKKEHPAIYCRPELSIPHHFFRLGIGQT